MQLAHIMRTFDDWRELVCGPLSGRPINLFRISGCRRIQQVH